MTPMDSPTLVISSSPHIHAPGSVAGIMRDVLLALVPAAVASVVFFGLRALFLIVVCIAASVSSEYMARRVMRRENTLGDLSAIITGLLLAFNLPPDLPLWMAALGGVFAIVVAKQIFGGLGCNPFNPALIARAFLLVSFTGAMTTWSASTWKCDPVSVEISEQDAIVSTTQKEPDAITFATPLGVAKTALKTGEAISFDFNGRMALDFLVGRRNGCIGETSVLALILGGIYLLVRRVITWHIPLIYMGTVALYAAILHLICPQTTPPPLFHLLAGGLPLGAFFMATDMATSPTTTSGKVVFAIGCGLLTMIIRTVPSGDYPEGVSFAILIMNAFTPLINRATRHKIFGTQRA